MLVSSGLRVFRLDPGNNPCREDRAADANLLSLNCTGVRGRAGRFPRNEGKMVGDSGGEGVTKTTIHIDKGEKPKKTVAVSQAQLIEGDGLKAQLKSAKRAFAGIVIARISKACHGHIREVILNRPEEKLENLWREVFPVGRILCALVVCDVRTEVLEIPVPWIGEDHALRQLHGSHLVAFLLRIHDVLCEVFQTANVVGVV